MKQLSKERLEQLANFRGAPVTLREEQEMARALLAGMAQEPVAYMTYKGYLLHAADPKLAEYSEPEPLYAAPPSPVVPESVSNRAELPSREHFISLCDEFWNWSEMDLCCANDRGYELRMEWEGNLFKHPVTQALWKMYQAAPVNSPVVPDAWIPCGERMPGMGETQCYVLAADFKNNYPPNIPNTQVGVYGDWFSDGNPTWDDGDGEDLHLKEVTHWHPLPAPPKKGV